MQLKYSVLQYTKPRWERDSGSSPYDSLESLVSYDVIWCHWVRRFPSNEGIKEGYPPLEIVILPLLAHLAWKRLQIDTDLLHIIASTVDKLSSGINIDDLEPQNRRFSEFSDSDRHYISNHEVAPQCAMAYYAEYACSAFVLWLSRKTTF